MNGVMERMQAMSLRQMLGMGVAVLVVLVTVMGILSFAARPSMSLLYAQLDEGAAGGVIRALEQRGVAYDVRAGAIYVDGAQRDELRLTLAGEGLPATGAKGYELLDSLSGFGTTAQMFDAAYWRAKEGEIARTIQSSPDISNVRVHIATESANPFARDARVTASVFVNGVAGVVSGDMARALRFLVASAVPRLTPDDVSIIDGSGRLLTPDGTAQSTDIAAVDDMRTRVQRLVEARVGPGNAVVEMSVDRVTETQQIVERTLDPKSRVAISVDSEERLREAENGGQALTVASNLPDGDGAADGQGRSQNTEARERIDYQVSETTRQISRAAGEIRRITVAVLVNGATETDGAGNATFTPLPEAELEDLKSLVASAVGFDAARGDEITIRSLPFEARPLAGTPALETSWFRGKMDIAQLSQIGALALVTILLGLFVVKPLLKPAAGQSDLPMLASSQTEQVSEQGKPVTDAVAVPVDDLPSTELAIADATQEEDPVDRLRGLIDARKEETVEVLRSWLDEKERV